MKKPKVWIKEHSHKSLEKYVSFLKIIVWHIALLWLLLIIVISLYDDNFLCSAIGITMLYFHYSWGRKKVMNQLISVAKRKYLSQK